MLDQTSSKVENQEDEEDYKRKVVQPQPFTRKQGNCKSQFQARRGLVHSGSFQTSIKLTQSNSEDQEMNGDGHDSEEVIVPGEEDEIQTEEQKQQISKIRDLRLKQRKSEEFISLDSASKSEPKTDQFSMNSIEAQVLKNQLIKEQYASSSAQQMKPLSRGIFDADITANQNMGSEDEEEVEALIKKRVKEGAGRDYDSIVKKDIVNYQKVNKDVDAEFADINRYENSNQYKILKEMMEAGVDNDADWAQEMDKELLNFTSAIDRNEKNLEELKSQEIESARLIEEAQALFESTGQQFINAKEACDMVEDLKDMLTEKSEIIDEILAKKLKMEKEMKKKVMIQLISHISDLFKEQKEHQQPYAYSQNFSEALEKEFQDHTQASLRKHFRSMYLPQEQDESLWKSIIDSEISKNSSKTISIEASSVFSDVDPVYESLQECLFPSISKIMGIDGFNMQLTDLVEYISPYLIKEMLSNREDLLISQDSSEYMNEIMQFIRSAQQYSEEEKQVFISVLITSTFHKVIMSYISTFWNPFDIKQTQRLGQYLKVYVDSIYVRAVNDFGMKHVTEVLNHLIHTLSQYLDLFHLTANTSVTLSFVNAVSYLSSAVLSFSNLLPPSDIKKLLEQLLCENFLKSLSKKLHKLQVEAQTSPIDKQEVERCQLAFELVMEEKELKQWFSQSERIQTLVKELQMKGLNV